MERGAHEVSKGGPRRTLIRGTESAVDDPGDPGDLLEGARHAVSVADVDPAIAVGGEPGGAQEVDVRARAAEEEDGAAGEDRGVHLRGEDVADELVAQGDQVGVRG